MTTIGERIKISGKRIGGNRALAARMDVTEQTISNYVRGRDPAISTLEKIAEHTDVSLMWIITGEEAHTAEIDIDVLKTCISETELQEKTSGVSLDPEGKAAVIVSLYNLVLKKQKNESTIEEQRENLDKKRAG